MVQIIEPRIFHSSLALHFHVTNLQSIGMKGLLVDFKNLNGSCRLNSKDFYKLLINEQDLIISCRLPSVFILEILLLIMHASKHHRILLSVDEITSQALYLLKCFGLTGLLSRQFELPPDEFQCAKVVSQQTESDTITRLINLSLTELEILYLISRGFKNSQIAELTNRSYHTIKNHKTNLIRKTGLDHSNQIIELVNNMKLSFA